MVDKTVSQENAAGAIQLADGFRGIQNGLTVRYSFQQVKSFVQGFSSETLLLSGSVANGDANLIIPIPAGYDVINIDFVDFQVSANAQLLLTVSVNGGSVFLASGYFYNFKIRYQNRADDDGQGENQANFFLSALAVNGVYGQAGSIQMMNPTSAIHHKRVFMHAGYQSVFGSNAMLDQFGALENTSPITHIKIAPSAGTFVTGTYLVRAGKK